MSKYSIVLFTRCLRWLWWLVVKTNSVFPKTEVTARHNLSLQESLFRLFYFFFLSFVWKRYPWETRFILFLTRIGCISSVQNFKKWILNTALMHAPDRTLRRRGDAQCVGILRGATKSRTCVHCQEKQRFQNQCNPRWKISCLKPSVQSTPNNPSPISI